jgi:hypothetical protein
VLVLVLLLLLVCSAEALAKEAAPRFWFWGAHATSRVGERALAFANFTLAAAAPPAGKSNSKSNNKDRITTPKHACMFGMTLL